MPGALGRPIVGGDLTAADSSSDGSDQRSRRGSSAFRSDSGKGSRKSGGDRLLVRLNAVEGGLPSAAELRPRLVADWLFAQQQHAVDEAVRAIVGRYRFEERSR